MSDVEGRIRYFVFRLVPCRIRLHVRNAKVIAESQTQSQLFGPFRQRSRALPESSEKLRLRAEIKLRSRWSFHVGLFYKISVIMSLSALSGFRVKKGKSQSNFWKKRKELLRKILSKKLSGSVKCFRKKKPRFNIISLSKFINSNDTYTFTYKDGPVCLTCNGVHENVE